MKQIREKLLGIFQGEHQDHSGQIRLLLKRIVEAGAGPDLDEAFRRAHSLKGAARAVGLDEIETVGHRLEALFARARKARFALPNRQSMSSTTRWTAPRICSLASAAHGPRRMQPGF